MTRTRDLLITKVVKVRKPLIFKPFVAFPLGLLRRDVLSCRLVPTTKFRVVGQRVGLRQKSSVSLQYKNLDRCNKEYGGARWSPAVACWVARKFIQFIASTYPLCIDIVSLQSFSLRVLIA